MTPLAETGHRRYRPLLLFLAWLPALLGVCVIFMESSESFGANHTSSPLRAAWQTLFGLVPDARWEVIHHLLRKSGHFIGYGTLGLLFYRAWHQTARILHRLTPRLKNILYALACTLIVASSDEYHQHLLPNRTGTPQDVLLDMIGACTLQLLVWLLILAIDRLGSRSHSVTV